MYQLLIRTFTLLLAVTFSLFSLSSFAQSFLNFGTNHAQTAGQSKTPQVMNQEQYSKYVTGLSNKTKDDLTTDAKAQFIKQPPVTSPYTPNAPANPHPPANTIPQPESETTPASPVEQSETRPAMTAPPAAPTQPLQTPNQSLPQNFAPQAPPTYQQQNKAQPYSGFGTGTTGTHQNTQAPASNSSGGGWNIKY